MNDYTRETQKFRYGEILIDPRGKRWKVNGEVKTWKRDKSRIRVPLKHGLYSYDALETEDFLFDADGTLICKILARGNND